MKKKEIKIQTEAITTIDEFTKAESIVIEKLNDNIHTLSNNLPNNCYVRACLECNVQTNCHSYKINDSNCSSCGYYDSIKIWCKIAPIAQYIRELYDCMCCGIVKEQN